MEKNELLKSKRLMNRSEWLIKNKFSCYEKTLIIGCHAD